MYTTKDLLGILEIIRCAGQYFYQRTRLQKLVCIAKYEKKIQYPFSFAFYRHFYGPYSFELKDMIERLTVDGLIEEEAITEKKNRCYRYNLTSVGLSLLEKMEEQTELAEDFFKIKKMCDEFSKEKNIMEIISRAKEVYGW